VSLSQRVSNALEHLKVRVGKQVTYKRFKTYEYDPTSGTVPTFWEMPSFKAVVGARTSETARPCGTWTRRGLCSRSI